MAQYRRSAKSKGYNPRRVDQSNIQRMREDSERTARAMREAAETEITDRRRISQQMREDQAATRQMEQKNYQILTGNLQRELAGLQAQAARDQQQYALDSKAANTILSSITNFSSTASKMFLEQEAAKRNKEEQKKWLKDTQQALERERAGTSDTNALIAQNTAVTANRVDALNRAEATGGADKLQTSELEVSEPSTQVSLGLAQTYAKAQSGAFAQEINRRIIEAEGELPDGETLSLEDKLVILNDLFSYNVDAFYNEGWSPALTARALNVINEEKLRLAKKFRQDKITFNNNQIKGQVLQTFMLADDQQKIIEFPTTWGKVLRQSGGDNRVAWEFLKPSMTAIDERTGKPLIKPDVLRQLPLKMFGKDTTIGEQYTNANGQEVGILREITSQLSKNISNWEKQRLEAEKVSHKKLEQNLIQALDPQTATALNYDEAQAIYVQETGGKVSQAIENRKKHLAKPLSQNQSEIQRILLKDDLELTKADEETVKIASSEGEAYQIIKQRRNGPGGAAQFEDPEVRKLLQTGTAAIRETSDFTQAGIPGSGPAELYFVQQVYKKALDFLGDPNQPTGYTLKEAVAAAVAAESAKYKEQVDTKNYNLEYAKKILPGGLVSYPWIEQRAGNVAMGEDLTQRREALRKRILKQAATGDPQAFGTIAGQPESIISSKRMEYLVNNPNEPPSRLERAALSYSNGMSLHEMRNRQYRALGGKEDIFTAPPILKNLKVSADLQSVLNDFRNSVPSKLNALNVAAGNTGVYQNPSLMRAGSVFKTQGATNLQSFAPQVSSVTFDTGQPGIDVFFENKQFPAVLSGKVKDISYQVNPDGSGYGHYVVIESTDPNTGQKVDVLYSHFGSKPNLQLNQTISQGQIIGIQGGSGSVQSVDGTIASIDFLAPAPRGSKSMTPYSNYESLRNSIASQLQNK